jgi:hypothetical protein
MPRTTTRCLTTADSLSAQLAVSVAQPIPAEPSQFVSFETGRQHTEIYRVSLAPKRPHTSHDVSPCGSTTGAGERAVWLLGVIKGVAPAVVIASIVEAHPTACLEPILSVINKSDRIGSSRCLADPAAR